MNKILVSALLIIISCGKTEKIVLETEPKDPIHKTLVDQNESQAARIWLEKSIKNYFNGNLGGLNHTMEEITTKEYYEYKTDATNVDMDVDGSLTEKEFHEKWKNQFNTKKAGIGVGFLISGQDWNKIEISKCRLISKGKNNFLFDVKLTDREYEAEYPIQVKVVKVKNQFFIADVLQD